MKQDMIKNYLKLFPIFLLLITVIFVDYAFAQDVDGPSIYNSQLDKLNQMFSNAHELTLDFCGWMLGNPPIRIDRNILNPKPIKNLP